MPPTSSSPSWPAAESQRGTLGMRRRRPAKAMTVLRYRGAVLPVACEPRGVAFGPSVLVPSDASAEDDARRNESIRAALSIIPSFDLPNRRYFLLRGAVTAASQIERPDGPFRQPPDLWWPDDRRWFVGGDTDLDCCYIAGSERLLSAVGAEFPGQTRPVGWRAPNAAVGE